MAATNNRCAALMQQLIEAMLKRKIQEMDFPDEEWGQQIKNLAAAHAEVKRTERK